MPDQDIDYFNKLVFADYFYEKTHMIDRENRVGYVVHRSRGRQATALFNHNGFGLRVQTLENPDPIADYADGRPAYAYCRMAPDFFFLSAFKLTVLHKVPLASSFIPRWFKTSILKEAALVQDEMFGPHGLKNGIDSFGCDADGVTMALRALAARKPVPAVRHWLVAIGTEAPTCYL